MITLNPNKLPPFLLLLRPHQWAKNVLLFLPMLLAHRFLELTVLVDGVLAVVCFSLLASSVYVFNDFLDVEADRQHPSKRNRPLASGSFPLKLAPPLSAGLAFTALTAAYFLLPRTFTLILLVYLASNFLYSFKLKHVPVLDVVFLTLMFVLRIYAGGVACGIEVTDWLLSFSLFFFLSIAFAKRVQELKLAIESDPASTTKVRGYLPGDHVCITQIGICSGMLSVLILALYVRDGSITDAYASSHLLWLLCPLILYWIGRFWLLTLRGGMGDDPVLFAIRDKISYVILFAVGSVVQAAYWLNPALFR
ncbi:MAG: UbiA family prenyltransferase [Kiritimatiellae bacterium]|jgi:4-hydroxybenzoate polyprenyltransferase|nr:UbiA family prenyltransferase [Kiritimatiellia bacterium]